MRGAIAAQSRDFFPAYHRALFPAMWEQEKNLGEEPVFRGVLEAAGINTAQVFELIETADVKDRLRANSDEAVSRGVFGAPSFFVGDELFFGNDRLDFVEQALKR
jgi:2-hydroxychromene-2-carboxylate isomerase